MKKITTNIVIALVCPMLKYSKTYIVPIISTIVLINITNHAYGQNSTHLTLTGAVISAEDNKPLPGATVSIYQTKVQTTTDKDGNFKLETAEKSGSLNISYVGFKTTQIKFSTDLSGPFQITLNVDPSVLKEVVVSTGYQTLSKERATGSFVQIDNKLLNRSVSTNIIDRLDGVTSGLIFNKNSSTIGVNPSSISIRGRSTIYANPNPLIVIDNFPYSGDISSINPNEGQVGTLKIFISRMATKETFWVFSGDDFDLKISDPQHPGVLILANDPSTQSINSACYSVVMNCILREINSKGNIPVGIVVDESPSLYCHRVDVCVSQARSNRVSVLLGMQELPMLRQQYGKETAETITSVMGNVLSGSVRNKDTLEWLERLFGKVKQTGESISIDRNKTSLSLNEKLEPLIPAGKIASLKAGEMVGLLASDAVEKFTGKYETSAVNCRINLDLEAIKKEEQAYKDLPLFYDFKGKKEEVLRSNYLRITNEVQAMARKFRKIPPQQIPGGAKGTMRPAHKH